MTISMTPRHSRTTPIGRRLAVAAAVLAPVGLLAGAGTAAAAGSATPPSASAFTAVTDATGLLTINVPAEWTATDLNPIDGEPSIWATTDLELYKEGVTVPGVSFDVAVHQETDTAARLTAFMSDYGIDEGDCDVDAAPAPRTTYAGTGHGALEGTSVLYDCGGSGVMGFVGLAVDGSGVEVFLQLPEGQDPGIADSIMGTFTYGDLSTLGTGTVPGGSGVPTTAAPAPGSTIPAVPVPTVPAVPVPTVTPAPVPVPPATAPAPVPTVTPGPAPVPAPPATAPAPVTVPGSVPATTVAGGPTVPGALAGQVPVVDDTGRLTLQVPAEWTDTNTMDIMGDPSVWAGTNLLEFDTSLTVPGVLFNVSGLVVGDPASNAVLQVETLGIDVLQCTEVAPMAPYTSPQTAVGVFSGAIITYDCDGSQVTSVVAVSPDGELEMSVLIKLAPGDDPAIADNILATFTLA